MNHALSADASVAAKWVLDEEYADHARSLLTDGLRPGQTLIMPPHGPGEVVNAIYQRIRVSDPAKRLDVDIVDRAVVDFLRFPVRILAPPDLYRQAFIFARDLALPSIYDSLYVVLAQLESVELWTADRRLLNALGGAAPWVRFIGDYPLQ